MVCDIHTQLLQGERNGVSGGLRLTVIQATQHQPFWCCEVRGDFVEVDCGNGPNLVTSRTALKLLWQALILRSALSDESRAMSTPANRYDRVSPMNLEHNSALSVVTL